VDGRYAPQTTVHADRLFVDNGRVVCSAGIAAGIDMSLHVASRLLGEEVAEKTAKQMEYPFGATP
jgi:transcriptional regulator GlxA family with amidase domain